MLVNWEPRLRIALSVMLAIILVTLILIAVESG